MLQVFAIVGAGPTAGIPIVKAFLAIGAPILVIAQPTSTNTSAVSALSADDPNLKIMRLHPSILADAAKEAGVKLFVPSEFILPQIAKGGIAFQKTDFAVYAKSIGLPTLRVFNGLFHEFVPWLTALADTGKFHIVNKGETPGSFTAVYDVVGYVARILTTQPPSRLLDVKIHIEGQRAAFSEITALYKGSVPVVHCDALPTEGVTNAPFRTFFQKHVGVGGGSCGWNPMTESDDPVSASRDNWLWEGHRWLTVGEVLGLY
ncbi:hypothetical protein DFH29DRAFT_992382 [Suillus ampliporus]|nr:hypothetical protein DFH29DRAFT_992382 [Suillus ampliporus]